MQKTEEEVPELTTLLVLGEAPWLMSWWTMFSCPIKAATWIGVRPDCRAKTIICQCEPQQLLEDLTSRTEPERCTAVSAHRKTPVIPGHKTENKDLIINKNVSFLNSPPPLCIKNKEAENQNTQVKNRSVFRAQLLFPALRTNLTPNSPRLRHRGATSL